MCKTAPELLLLINHTRVIWVTHGENIIYVEQPTFFTKCISYSKYLCSNVTEV